MRLNHPQGAAAEEAAWRFLQAQGCRLLARNWHCPYGEIDLVVEHRRCVVFVEVRFRSGRGFGGAAASITPAKLAKLRRSAEYYLQQHPGHTDCRIDALLLEPGRAPEWLHNISE